jgi:N-acyl-D-aspartate/D-glutamate deacylase
MGLADAGSGVIELISDFDTPDLDSEFAMIRRWWKRRAGRCRCRSRRRARRKAGAEISRPDRRRVARRPADPRAGGAAADRLLLGLQGTLNPFVAHETFAAIKDKPLAEKVAIMRDPDFRARCWPKATRARAIRWRAA